MNLIIVGSCSDTSALASGLNKRLSNSLVYRHDLLASLKNIPLGNSFENSRDTLSNAGEYLGDIETINPNTVKKGTLDKIKTAVHSLITSSSNEDSFEANFIKESLNKFSKKVITFNSVSLSIVNVFSGVINKKMLENLIPLIDNPLIVNISDKEHPLFDISITEKEINQVIEEKGDGMFLGTFKDISSLLNSSDFKSLFSDYEEKKVEPEEVKEKKEATASAGTITATTANGFMAQMMAAA